MLDPENRNKIGIGLIAGSGIFFFLGITLLFNRSLLIIGNLCFLAGLYFLIGLNGTINFLFKNKKGRVQGTALYLGGLLFMIIFKLAFIGFLIQLIGLVLVFRDFLPWLKGYTFNLPVVGKYLRKLIDILSPAKENQV